MAELWKNIRDEIVRYHDVLRFFVVLFAANFFWKFTVIGNEYTIGDVSFFGFDISAPFVFMSYHVAYVVNAVCGWFGYDTELVDTSIYFIGSGCTSRIVWGCTGLKQSFIFLMALLLSRGPIVHKIWYSLLGLVVIYFVNIARIAIIAMIIDRHPDMFVVMHDYVMKYLFYAIIFGMWVIWQDFVKPNVQKNDMILP